MKKFIGTKTIKAKFMTRGDYNAHVDIADVKDGNDEAEGYIVGYSDANGNFNGPKESGCYYISWSPSDVFEAAYNEVLEDFTARVIQEKKELDEKAEKLTDFFNSPIYHSLDGMEQKRLNCQFYAMELYSHILSERIGAFDF